MLRNLKQLVLTTLFALFASQASAMFIQPDWFDPTQPGVGTNRYAYSHNDPVNITDPNGNCTNDATCEGEWDDPTKTADDRQSEDGVADASTYDGRDTYMLDPKELGLDRILDVGTAIQKYISSGNPAYQKSDLKRAIDQAIASGKPVEFSVTGLPISVSPPEKSFTEAGRIYGDFQVDVIGNISVDGSRNYSIDGATATVNQSEQYNFDRDGRNPIVNFAIGVAAGRPNMNGQNVPIRAQSRTGIDPRYNSTYGDANINTQTNRTYNFRAWGRY